ncbi:zinc finger CCHC domain-containing protein 8 [Biomphalaria pfeifferi]|uniref:Zinc finger CCHC domain-containing protein 8 n=1 Tax=Biomphalaria pfeifferi TaxID=112525 RepID=A0AAD8FD57_BIOPF|nr:zinc finger CCHC domain-containing protein 8 [Biomphalaria pfeifferi]
MADVFGDLDLFSEFDKDREAKSSYIHYEEDSVKSRIVFEHYESEEESESEDEFVEPIDTNCSSSAHAENEKEQPSIAEAQEQSEAPMVLETPTEAQTELTTVEGLSSDKIAYEQNYTKEDVGSDMTQMAMNSMTMNTMNMGLGDGTEHVNMAMTTDMTMVTDMSLTDETKMEYYMDQGYEGMIMDETYGYGYGMYNGYEYKKPEVEIKLSPEDEAKAAWLNEQLHAEAAEEAKKQDISVQQLIYDRNKFRRYAKILDSTRYVPDDDSPAVQLLFHNNNFARKYRQQIEQFIKGLLWEEFHLMSQDSSSDVLIKPGHPSCIDINDNLEPESRTEKMRQRHGIIGNSQFHKQFLIDFLGWPYSEAEPTRCNVNWEIPLYMQVFNEVYADPSNKMKKTGPKRPKQVCWNCGEENHTLVDCKQPKVQAQIAMNRKDFMSHQQQNEPKFTGPSRYHLDQELSSKFTKFKPGMISDSLREALGLADHQLPQHIYKMRLFGYPPGWLAEARQVESGVSIFDKNGQVTLITGECLEDGELDEDKNQEKMEYDVNKIIEYPGFTVAIPPGFEDEYATYQMPPIQQHQLKETLLAQSNTEKTSSRKRKREKEEDKEDAIKKLKNDYGGVEEEDGESKSESESAGEQKSSSDIPVTPKPMFRSSSTISLSKDFGTPILVREKIHLPDAAKFGKNIEEHIPFENLPNSTGIFDKMKDLLEVVRKKIKK